MESNELLLKAREASSPEELRTRAKENGLELSEEEARAYFDVLAQSGASGEVADEELENVSGGACHHDGHTVVSALHWCKYWTCEHCGAVFLNAPTIVGKRKHECSDGNTSHPFCTNCKYCIYKDALWLCTNHK